MIMDMFEDDFIDQAQKSATQWARGLLVRDRSSWVILDTETTGLGSYDEVCQVAVIDGAGNVLINNLLIKPTVAITEGARSLHGISNEMLESAPRFSHAWHFVAGAISGKHLVIYNAEFDLRILHQSGRALDHLIGFDNTWDCAMLEYAKWVGEWNDYHGSFRWQRLPSAEHSALGDCRAVLELIKKMAGGDGWQREL
jgi:DNA polymerase III subunit epsilon